MGGLFHAATPHGVKTRAARRGKGADMAEEGTTTTGGEGAQAAQPSVDELMAQVKALTDERDKAVAESRKWEGRSKSNSEKAKKYDELAAQSMNDAERADAEKARADEAEAKLAQYEADAQFAKDAAEVSEKYGVPASLLTERDRKAMEVQAQAIKAFATNQPTAQVFSQDGTKPGSAPKSKEEQFAELFAPLQL